MKPVIVRLSIAFLAVLTGLVVSLGQAPGPAVPFATTPSISAFNRSSGVTLAMRASDSSYSLFTFGLAPPYGILSSISSFARFLSSGMKLPSQSMAGPAGVGQPSQDCALGDFVGDGTAGVACISMNSNPTVTVYQGSTTFVYSKSTSYRVGGAYPAGIGEADFNGDGKLDLAVPYLGNSSAGGVAILLNDGSGGFAPAVNYPVGSSPISVAAFDLNGDGILDLAVADNSQPANVFVMVGNGDGTFANAVPYPVGTFPPQTVAIADYDLDGHPDLAVGDDNGSVYILLGNGDGTFRAGTSFKTVIRGDSVGYIAAADFDADGKPDLAVACFDGTISMYLGNGDGTFQLKSIYAASNFPNSLIVTDYNGDGKPDIINGLGDARGFGPGDQSGNIDVLLGNGDGTFQGTPIYVAGNGPTAIGDFNGDGKPDVVAPNGTSAGVVVFPGNGDGTLQPGVTYITDASTTSIDVADFNGDGNLDIVTNTSLLLGNGDGTFQPSIPLPVTGFSLRVLAGDFNKDGKPDLAVVDMSAGTVSILLGSGNGMFQSGASYSVGTNPIRAVIADFNRDGATDLAVVSGFYNGTPAAVSILLGNGDGTFQGPSSTFTGQGPYFDIATGDFNGDGIPDLAVPYETMAANGSPFIAVLLGNGDGTFQAPANVPFPNNGNPDALAAADFDGDGKLDLVVAGCCGVANMMYLAGNGDGTFQNGVVFLGGPSPQYILAGDLNGDEKPDLVISNRGGISPLLNSNVSPQNTIRVHIADR